MNLETACTSANASPAPNGADGGRKRVRMQYTCEQLAVLQAAFDECRIPSRASLPFLVQRTGLTAAQIKTWFNNRRHRVHREPPSTPTCMEDGEKLCESTNSEMAMATATAWVTETSPALKLALPLEQHTQRSLLASMLRATPAPWSVPEVVRLAALAQQLGRVLELAVPEPVHRVECPFDEALELLMWDRKLEDYGADAIAEAWAAAQ